MLVPLSGSRGTAAKKNVPRVINNTMEARTYYNSKTVYRRKLEDGDGIRNTHNFLKATLINMYIPENAHIIDLGCGQGGDILKYKRRSPKSYRGIDISHTAVECASMRMLKSGVKFRVTFECFDFCTHDWGVKHNPAQVVSCQFAIQYAFVNRECAENVIRRIASVLCPGGFFIGTVPVHADVPAYEEVVVQLPDDARKCVEFSAEREEFERICAQHHLKLVHWSSFDDFYDHSTAENPGLRDLMRAYKRPDPKNAVFAFMYIPSDSETTEGATPCSRREPNLPP